MVLLQYAQVHLSKCCSRMWFSIKYKQSAISFALDAGLTLKLAQISKKERKVRTIQFY